MSRNIALMPWYGFLRNLMFWQATWFLFFQNELSAAEAILLYAIYDLSTVVLEVPSGWMSDRLGRRRTLVLAAIAGGAASVALVLGEAFWVFAFAQFLLGAHAAFVSGTDSAMLFESLKAEGRGEEIEAQQVRLWRFSFAALAFSAVTGGALALWWDRLPFLGAFLAFAALVIVALRLKEPVHAPTGSFRSQLATLAPAFRNRILLWLFAISVAMYGFSHIPFVFGQPFILDALARAGFDGQAPLVSGFVTSIMMAISFAVSLGVPSLKARIGLAPLVLAAFGIQVGLAACLALTNAPWAIALLFFRMVPDSLSTPFIIARIQPLLDDETRATYLSLKSFFGRLLFAATLYVAAGSASNVGAMAFAEISGILTWYALGGVVLWLLFALTAGRAGVDTLTSKPQAD